MSGSHRRCGNNYLVTAAITMIAVIKAISMSLKNDVLLELMSTFQSKAKKSCYFGSLCQCMFECHAVKMRATSTLFNLVLDAHAEWNETHRKIKCKANLKQTSFLVAAMFDSFPVTAPGILFPPKVRIVISEMIYFRQ